MTDCGPKPAEEYLLLFSTAVTNFGPGDQYGDLDILQEFEQRERADTMLSNEVLRSFTPPEWVKELFVEGATSQGIINELLDRIRRTPSHNMHIIAEIVVNELGETEDGARAVREAITEPLLRELESIHLRDDYSENGVG